MRRVAADTPPVVPFPRPGVTARDVGRFRRHIDYVKAWEAAGRSGRSQVLHLKGEGRRTLCSRAASVHRSTEFESAATCSACRLAALLSRLGR